MMTFEEAYSKSKPLSSILALALLLASMLLSPFLAGPYALVSITFFAISSIFFLAQAAFDVRKIIKEIAHGDEKLPTGFIAANFLIALSALSTVGLTTMFLFFPSLILSVFMPFMPIIVVGSLIVGRLLSSLSMIGTAIFIRGNLARNNVSEKSESDLFQESGLSIEDPTLSFQKSKSADEEPDLEVPKKPGLKATLESLLGFIFAGPLGKKDKSNTFVRQFSIISGSLAAVLLIALPIIATYTTLLAPLATTAIGIGTTLVLATVSFVILAALIGYITQEIIQEKGESSANSSTGNANTGSTPAVITALGRGNTCPTSSEEEDPEATQTSQTRPSLQAGVELPISLTSSPPSNPVLS